MYWKPPLNGLMDTLAVRWIIDRKLHIKYKGLNNDLGHMGIVGFIAQALFTARFGIQWIASEKRKAYIFLKLSGTFPGCGLPLVYSIHRRTRFIILVKLRVSHLPAKHLFIFHQKRIAANARIEQKKQCLMQYRVFSYRNHLDTRIPVFLT
jgi:lipid-A-disaccharide synthase-like uncharacterized protein